MNIDAEVEAVQEQLLSAASLMNSEGQQAVAQVAALLSPTIRVALQDVLVAAASDLADQLDGVATVSVELQDGSPVLVARPVPTEGSYAAEGHPSPTAEEPTTRFTLRVPDSLKAQAEQVAARSGTSLNTWVVGAIRSALSTPSYTSAKAVRGWMA